jgi:hypothetical protein
LREWDVWQKHPEYNTVLALICKVSGETVAKLEKAGFKVDDGTKPPVKADQLFMVHMRESMDKKDYWKKFDEITAKYGKEPTPIHLEEMPEVIIRFLGNVSEEQCLRIIDDTISVLLKSP